MSEWINLDKQQSDRFGTGTVNYRHRLRDSGLFEDDKLAGLIERTPREHYMLTTMSHVGEKKVWRNGDFNGLSGQDVLDAIKNGQLWLSLRNFDKFAPEYQALIDAAFLDRQGEGAFCQGGDATQ